VNPTDSDAMAPAVKQLTDAKIPVVAVDRAVNNANVASYIASDNETGGKQAAGAVASESVGLIITTPVPEAAALASWLDWVAESSAASWKLMARPSNN